MNSLRGMFLLISSSLNLMDDLNQHRYNNLMTALCHIRSLIDGIEGQEEIYDRPYFYPDDLKRAKKFLEGIH